MIIKSNTANTTNNNSFFEADEGNWSETDNEPKGWGEENQDTDEGEVEESAIFDGFLMETDTFIEPTAPTVDETEPQINPEKDNYGNDPEKDDAVPEMMKDDDTVETVTSESEIFDGFLMETDDGFIEPTAPTVDETEPANDLEKDNYGNDPEKDDAVPEMMKDDDTVETVTSEGFDSFFDDGDIL